MGSDSLCVDVKAWVAYLNLSDLRFADSSNKRFASNALVVSVCDLPVISHSEFYKCIIKSEEAPLSVAHSQQAFIAI